VPRWQSFLAIVAIFFVAGALWPWSPLNRLVCAGLAVAFILVVLASRLQQHAANLTSSRSTIKDMESRIDRIREEREKRLRRR
jgi:Ca2+/H+ antiporter